MEKYVHIADEGAMIVMGRYEQSQQEQSTYQSEQALEESLIGWVSRLGRNHSCNLRPSKY